MVPARVIKNGKFGVIYQAVQKSMSYIAIDNFLESRLGKGLTTEQEWKRTVAEWRSGSQAAPVLEVVGSMPTNKIC